jgi:hypothetical protein
VSSGGLGSPRTGAQYLQQQQQQQEGQELAPSYPNSFTLQPQESSLVPLSVIGASGAASGPAGGDPSMGRASAAALLELLTAQLTPTVSEWMMDDGWHVGMVLKLRTGLPRCNHR